MRVVMVGVNTNKDYEGLLVLLNERWEVRGGFNFIRAVRGGENDY